MATRFYTEEQLGKNQALTPEGFLVCTDVPVARTGTMKYHYTEIPVTPNRNGEIVVHRDAEAIFDEEFLASLVGKSVVNDHPPVDVAPENFKQYEMGVGMNPRRGTGMQADLILMDLIIKDKETIQDVRSGKREISLGYDAEYEEIAPGEGRQKNLIGNHIALVDAGRCGSRCAIADRSSTLIGASKMATKKSATWDKLLARLKKSFQYKDEDMMNETMDEFKEAMKDEGMEAGSDNGATHVHVNVPKGADSKFTDDDHEEYRKKNEEEHAAMKSRLDALEAKMKDSEEGKDGEKETKAEVVDAESEEALAEEAPVGTGDKAMKAKDSAYMEDSYKETVALAEILAPGIRIPTFDMAAQPKKTLDAVCNLRRSALEFSNNTPDGRNMIEEINGKPLSLSGMKCNAVRSLFRAAATMKKAANNNVARTGDNNNYVSGTQAAKGITLADLNKRNRELYK